MTVRHRGSGTPPNAAPPAAKSDPPGAVDNGAVGGGGPVRPRRRRDLGSKKQLSVLGGSLVVLVLCLLGMRSASVDDGRAARKATPKNERHKLPSRHKEQMRDKIKKREKLQRPRGIGRRKDEDFFPIPKSPKRYDDADVPRKEHQSQRDEDPPEPVPREPPRREKRHDQKRMKDAELRGKDRKRHKVKRTDEDRANDEEESSEFAVGERTIRRNGAQGGHPRVLGLHLEAIPGAQRASADEDDEEEEYPKFSVALSKVHLLPVHESRTLPSSDRFVSPYPDDEDYWERQETIKKSKKYRGGHREPLEDKQCKPRHEWQAGAFPNCNVIHEYELGQLTGVFGRALRKKLVRKEGEGDEMVKYLAHGYWRDVWMVSKTGPFESRARDPESEFEEEITALKTLRYRHDFTDRNYDRHRKDALASERLSGSPNVIDIYAYCSNTAVYEYGAGGDIEGKLWAFDEKEDNYYTVDMTGAEKLDIAYQVARGIADMHDVEDDGHASIAHTDITPSQFIFINGRWKMNDFNRCRFMRVYKDDNRPCGFYVGANPGKFRAPEEYEYDEEDEMIDVYSMGNIFYTILAGEMPFEGQKESKAQKKVIEGKRPDMPDEVLESEDIAIKALVRATKMCWEQKPGDRPSAAAVRDDFKKVLDRINDRKES